MIAIDKQIYFSLTSLRNCNTETRNVQPALKVEIWVLGLFYMHVIHVTCMILYTTLLFFKKKYKYEPVHQLKNHQDLQGRSAYQYIYCIPMTQHKYEIGYKPRCDLRSKADLSIYTCALKVTLVCDTRV